MNDLTQDEINYLKKLKSDLESLRSPLKNWLEDHNHDGILSQIINKANISVLVKYLIDDTAGDGDTNLVYSADKIVELLALKATLAKRVVTTTDDATAMIDVSITDDYELTAIANATEFSMSGAGSNGQTIFIRFKDAGVSKGLTWTGITPLGVTLPSATTAGKWHIVGLKYFASVSTWFAIAESKQA